MAEQPTGRLTWDQYFMKVAHIVSERSTCLRAHIGAVIVRDRNILATGYNGSPSGLPHCTEVGCEIYTSTTPEGEVVENCVRTIHAEINSIAQAARNGSAIDGADVYITASPCINCLKVLINVGIHTIYYAKSYKLETIEPIVAQVTSLSLHNVVVPEGQK
ncbi:MAG: dCMP deaminase family protein [Candidatus Latescibacteria bacterium]|nr:dCMP deaminase family protein [Candidatus Latescibacterota bacterium]